MAVLPRVCAVAAALLLAGCASGSSTSAPSPSRTATPPSTGALPGSPTTAVSTSTSWAQPCTGSPAPARYDHVVWIVMENKDVGSVNDAPQTARLAKACGWGADHHAATHPSLPNYLALTSGSTHGVRDDHAPADHPIDGPSIFGQAASSGIGWATYAESMPAPCSRTSDGRYAVKHNPAAYYTQLRPTCDAHDLPLGTTGDGPLAAALTDGSLPGFVLVVPDLCSDTHDCGVDVGDAWLGRWLRAIVESPVYAQGRTAVMVTWDEDEEHGDNHVGLLLVAPSIVPGTVVRTRTTHAALLRTTEDLLGLPALTDEPSFRSAAHL